MIYESEVIEYKESYTEDMYKTVVAFANTAGGTLHIGIDNSGNPVGIKDIDQVYTKITNGIRDAISPDVTMFVKYKLTDNSTIEISVNEGSSKPYYLNKNGIKPSGIYVRQGASNAQASWQQIKNFIKLSDGESFEENISINQELTFNYAQNEFKKKKLVLDESKYANLGLKSLKGNLYSNLAMIISEQCPYTIKVAVFDDENKTVFKDRKEFSGSIFKQLYDTYDYLMLCNSTRSEIRGLNRIDSVDYPNEAIRECLLNSIIHREYSFSGSIIINVTNRDMEFISIGGLISGLSQDDILNGISQPRNRRLADIFYRLKHIEAYGTGIRRIFSLYTESEKQPEIIITPNTFKIILPNLNYYNSLTKDEMLTKFKSEVSDKLNSQVNLIIDYIKKNGKINDAELQKLLNVKKTRSYIIAKHMIDNDLIVSNGYGGYKYYTLKDLL